jgi:MarR family transcriptional regulator, temperature-dependent positive regulator of motility
VAKNSSLIPVPKGKHILETNGPQSRDLRRAENVCHDVSWPERFELYCQPGHLIRRLQQAAVSLFLDAARSLGLEITPVQYAALRAIETYPKIDQATLAGVIAYDRATIGGVADRLESKGLVRRTLSPGDRRVRLLVIEPAGSRLLKKLEPSIKDVQDRILEPLTPEEKAEFLRLLVKLAEANNAHSRAPLRPI